MTPKCSICFIFGLFDLLFVCLRPTTLRVVTSQYLHLHHLQSYVQSNLGEAWTSSRYGEPYGKCAVLKMTSNDPKMIYLLYFWTFWLLFVCLRPTTLRVGSYIYLHHLQSYLRSINRWGRAGGGGAIERTKPEKKKRELCETRGTKVGT
jgi:hypothetical protein